MTTEAQIDIAIDKLFKDLRFSEKPKGLYDPLRYMLEIGGKRIRPRLCLSTYSLFKDDINDEILMPAAAVEVFHSFTLIHDDIMDKASVRRGVPTVHCKWDENTAILSGDVMSIESYKLIAKAPEKVLSAVLSLFSTTANQVCEGQQYDMEFESQEDISMGEYLKMIGLKTAVLIACSAKIGGLIADAPKEACDHLYSYGYNIGLGFQIADDYLDTFGDSAEFGKSIGGDILNNKKTWLAIRTIEKGYGAELKEAQKLRVDTEEEKAHKIAAVTAIYKKAGVDGEAKAEILRLNNEAMAEAEKIGLSKVRLEILHRYANSLLGRTR